MHETTSTAVVERPGASDWLQRQWQIIKGRVRSQWHPHRLFLFDRDAGLTDVDAALEAFVQWCEQHPGAVCTVGLSSRWLLGSVSRIESDHEAARRHALQQWAHYLDMDEAQLASDWVLRQLPLAHASLVCAAPVALIEGLRERASWQGVRLDGVGPWWAARVQAWLASQSAPDAGEPVQLEWQLREPGLRTCVRAQPVAGAGLVLSELWTEVAAEAEPYPSDPAGCVLPAPSTQERQGHTHEQHIWSHPGVVAMLRDEGEVRT